MKKKVLNITILQLQFKDIGLDLLLSAQEVSEGFPYSTSLQVEYSL